MAAAFVKLEGAVSGLLSETDLNEVADALEPGSTAAGILTDAEFADQKARLLA